MYQIMMVIGAFMLLSLTTISVDRAVIDKMENTYQSESVIAASTIAQALLQEVCLREFDEKSIAAPIDSTSKLTSAASLGRDGESYPYYDDIDDYKNYARYDTVRNGVFKSTVNVQYVTWASPNDSSANPTFYKKVFVSVTNTDSTKMKVPVTLTTIVSY